MNTNIGNSFTRNLKQNWDFNSFFLSFLKSFLCVPIKSYNFSSLLIQIGKLRTGLSARGKENSDKTFNSSLVNCEQVAVGLLGADYQKFQLLIGKLRTLSSGRRFLERLRSFNSSLVNCEP